MLFFVVENVIGIALIAVALRALPLFVVLSPGAEYDSARTCCVPIGEVVRSSEDTLAIAVSTELFFERNATARYCS